MRLPLLLIGITLFPGTLRGQDGHYWTQQYGTKSMLLSGSVIGGVEDLGAVYYNPGRLAQISNVAFLLSANVYEYNAISITNAFGTSRNASRSDIKGVPTLAAGTFKIKQLPKHFFAYAIMTRQSSDLTFNFQDEVTRDVFANLPGKETFGAELNFQQKYLEQWIGLTWSHALSEKFSIGVTTNYTVNNQSKTNKFNLQAVDEAKEVATYKYNRAYSYKQTGLIWKIGLAGTVGKWQLGTTVTTPIVSLSGTGTYTYENVYAAFPGLGKPSTYGTSYQEGLDLTHKTPWSVGFGASRSLGKNKIHLSTEWFSSVPMYTLMQAKDHKIQSDTTQIISFTLMDKVNSVWNFGIGGELYISPKVSGFASFSTDFSTVTNDIPSFISMDPYANSTSWKSDFYHIGGGVVLKLKGADITLGATHTGAAQQLSRPISFPDDGGGQIIGSGPAPNADLTWDRWRLVFSFSFPFLKDYADKLSGEDKDKK